MKIETCSKRYKYAVEIEKNTVIVTSEGRCVSEHEYLCRENAELGFWVTARDCACGIFDGTVSAILEYCRLFPANANVEFGEKDDRSL